MSTHKKALAGKLLAGGLATALGVLGMAGVATADPTAPPVPPQIANIDDTVSGTITLTKHIGAPVPDASADGTHKEGITNPTAAGVEFSLWEVGLPTEGACGVIDLNTPEGWAAIKNATAQSVQSDAFCLTKRAEATTDGNGQIVWNNLSHRLFLVIEGDTGDNSIIQPAEDFLVSVPYPNSGNWLYNVYVYPKNAAAQTPGKTIAATPDDVVIGDDSVVTWTITEPVPALNGDEELKTVSAWDQIPACLIYTGVSATVGTEELTPIPAVPTVSGDPMVWTFEGADLDVLNANVGALLSVNVQTRVADDCTGWTGAIVNNQYGVEFNSKSIPGHDEPYTYWGHLQIMKVDQANKPLKNAEFAVYNAMATAASCPALPRTDSPVATGKSGDTGKVVWADGRTVLGLWIADSQTALPNPSRDYCIYEVKAPAGYTASPITNPVTITPSAGAPIDITVVNRQIEGPSLPLTGANGTALMTFGGSALILLAGGIYLTVRRRKM